MAEAWSTEVADLGGDEAMAASDRGVLESMSGEAHRRYHTLRHIECVLRDSGRLADELSSDVESNAILRLAECAHDVIYAGMPGGGDERASARAGAF